LAPSSSPTTALSSSLTHRRLWDAVDCAYDPRHHQGSSRRGRQLLLKTLGMVGTWESNRGGADATVDKKNVSVFVFLESGASYPPKGRSKT
jgi:hypothetical protein